MRRVALPVACVASVLAAASLWLPWHRSGEVERSGVALARAANRLGWVEGGWTGGVLVAGQVLPVLASIVVAAAATRRGRAAGAVAVLVGVVALGVALTVWREVPGHLSAGPSAAGVSGALAVASGLVCLLGPGGEVLSGDGGSGSS